MDEVGPHYQDVERAAEILAKVAQDSGLPLSSIMRTAKRRASLDFQPEKGE